ncbi:MAG TPA: hypothetical protein PKG48_11405 [Bacteroidales bacterium]|nr:hypothetical protein [Bacteroidales bacterium]
MDKTTFLTIYRTFERLEMVKQTLPGIVEETRRQGARLIVHDTSVEGREEKWRYLQDLNRENDFFLILSSNCSSAHVANMCLQLGQELYAPDYICIVEDDHGFLPGMIGLLMQKMKEYYGQVAPNGLRFGVFTGCAYHNRQMKTLLPSGDACPSPDEDVNQMGRANACFRCAPTSHWNNVLKGFDTDEYLISNYQVSNLNRRNYHKGFTSMLVQNGEMCTFFDEPGRGASDQQGLKRWDEVYTASDPRSRYKNK